MTKIKFDKCFTENKKVSIEDMVTSDGRLRREYNPDALYCPLCKKARLKFTSATSQRVAYLSTWPDAVHSTNCSYGVPMASKTETKTYFKELTEAQVKDKLIACVRWMSREQSAEKSAVAESDNTPNPFIIDVKKNDTYQRRSLLRKSIRFARKDPDDYLETPILFYGTVKIAKYVGEAAPGAKWHSLELLNPNTGRRYMYLPNGNDLQESKDIEEGKTYYFAFIGKYVKGKPFPWKYLPQAVYYEPLL